MKWIYHDGGRAKAGYKGSTRDCVCRAIALAMGQPYDSVYESLTMKCKDEHLPKCMGKNHPRTGISKELVKSYLNQYGFEYVPKMKFGEGCQCHLRDGEIPMQGVVIVQLSRHVCTVIDGVVYDLYDPSRDGTRCVYGYFIPKKK